MGGGAGYGFLRAGEIDEFGLEGGGKLGELRQEEFAYAADAYNGEVCFFGSHVRFSRRAHLSFKFSISPAVACLSALLVWLEKLNLDCGVSRYREYLWRIVDPPSLLPVFIHSISTSSKAALTIAVIHHCQEHPSESEQPSTSVKTPATSLHECPWLHLRSTTIAYQQILLNSQLKAHIDWSMLLKCIEEHKTRHTTVQQAIEIGLARYWRRPSTTSSSGPQCDGISRVSSKAQLCQNLLIVLPNFWNRVHSYRPIERLRRWFECPYRSHRRVDCGEAIPRLQLWMVP